MESQDYYHVVFRPALSELPDINSFTEFVASKCKYYLVSAERGSSSGAEPYNHFDCVLAWKGSPRTDSVKRALCAEFSIPNEHRRNVKVYVIESKRFLYQIGYSCKESIQHLTNIESTVIEQGREEFDKIGLISEEKFKEEKMTTDQLADAFVAFIRDLRGKNNNPTISLDIQGHYDLFMQKALKHVKYSTYHKISRNSLTEYATYILEGERSERLHKLFSSNSD